VEKKRTTKLLLNWQVPLCVLSLPVSIDTINRYRLL